MIDCPKCQKITDEHQNDKTTFDALIDAEEHNLELHAEIERLQSAYDAETESKRRHQKLMEEQQAEVLRLRAELAKQQYKEVELKTQWLKDNNVVWRGRIIDLKMDTTDLYTK